MSFFKQAKREREREFKEITIFPFILKMQGIFSFCKHGTCSFLKENESKFIKLIRKSKFYLNEFSSLFVCSK